MSDPDDTQSDAYTRRLESLSDAGWKRFFDVQAPYRWNIRRLDLGFTLDVGCGIGRNLVHLGGQGVGIDHNPDSIEAATRPTSPVLRPLACWLQDTPRPGHRPALLA